MHKGPAAPKDFEKSILDEIESDVVWYGKRSDQSHFWHKTLSCIVIIGSIFAPLSVVGASATVGPPTTSLGVLGLSPDFLAKLSVVLTIIVGLAEGFRRRFKFEHKWHAFYRASVDLKRVIQDYTLDMSGPSNTPPNRAAQLRALIKQWRSVVDTETAKFFDMELEASEMRASARHRNTAITVDPK